MKIHVTTPLVLDHADYETDIMILYQNHIARKKLVLLWG